ncbi:protein kinase family protein [Sphingobacterium griseoflavum]|uniref:Carboxypeptidase-like regulatory domain-containing protein n=1 Tax=Sphingobacterium griseoflavum TaxID=1474952 RepID=A0ABQ3HSJ6_9SPHI|nr:hypothetical protein [Sphingobacterium griseoflavum]GHE29591.1 hypothetical protein GCM10017764_10670 [Sphingobacterium griseoflavum]
MEIIKHILFTFLISFFSFYSYAQIKPVQGIVFDKDTNQRIGKVFIKNEKTKENTFNNLRGEFDLNVALGDMVVTTKEGFFTDTIRYTGQQVLMIYLKRSSIYIPEVNVVARRSPEEVLKQRQEDFSKAFKLADPGSIFSVGPTGAGLSIGSIYNMLSREGKNARRLTSLIRQEYEENVIDSKFTPDLVSNLTGLSGQKLNNFMRNYRPTYYFVSVASPYELSAYIRSKYEIFKLNPNLRFLPTLPDINLEVNN